MEIVYDYQRKRSDFGRHAEFSTSQIQSLFDIQPDLELQKQFILQEPGYKEVQTIVEYSEASTNTNTIELRDQGMIHLEGGWPKDVDITEVESKNRYIKKVTNTESYAETVAQLAPSMIHFLKQNISLNIYEEYFGSEDIDFVSDPPSAKTVTVFKDPGEKYNRAAVHTSWFPVDGKKIAVAYAFLQFQQMPEGADVDSYIWDVSNPNAPESKLSPSSPLLCIEYNPRENNTLVGGSYNGVITLFDIRKGSGPVEYSDIKNGHRDPVYKVKWLQSKTHSECISVSTDGQIIIWDTRALNQPLGTFLLDLTKGTVADHGKPPEKYKGLILGGESLDYDASYSHNKFLVGSEQGVIVSCTRRRKDNKLQIDRAFCGHHGPVYALQRNPFFPKYFLSIGDWTARIWMEELETPIISTRYHDTYLTDGCWSPSRPGVFFTTKADGSLDVWDFLLKQNRPVLSVNLSDKGLQCINVYDGRHLVVGSVDGTTSIVELCDGLSGFKGEEKIVQSSEKEAILAMFERETKREMTLTAQRKELLHQKQQASKSQPEKSSEKSIFKIDTSDLNELTDEFMKEIEGETENETNKQ